MNKTIVLLNRTCSDLLTTSGATHHYTFIAPPESDQRLNHAADGIGAIVYPLHRPPTYACVYVEDAQLIVAIGGTRIPVSPTIRCILVRRSFRQTLSIFSDSTCRFHAIFKRDWKQSILFLIDPTADELDEEEDFIYLLSKYLGDRSWQQYIYEQYRRRS